MTTTPHTTPAADALRSAMNRAFNLGQKYWQQVDSESYKEQNKSNITHDQYKALLEVTCANLAASAPVAPAPQPASAKWRNVLPGGRMTDKWDSARIADYNSGWNDYRKAAAAALENVANNNVQEGKIQAAQWLRDNYQDYPNIASLCDAMLAAAPKADHIADASKMVPAPLQQGEYLPTGNPEADRVLGRLNSSDPDFDDCAEAAALIYKLVAEIKGPEGFSTWKDAAIYERGLRATLETTINTASPLAYLYTDGKHPGLDFEHAPAEDIRPGFVCIPLVAAHLAAPAPVAEDAEIRKALHDAATSLETISRIAGRDQYMLGMMDVRLYAAARAKVAREVQAAQTEGGEPA